MDKKEKRRVFLYGMGAGLLLFTLLFVIHFFENPGEMRFPAIVPDGTENALGAYNFYRYGEFKFALNHIWHPVRYPIFCQIIIFLPGMILSGGEMVWGVAGVWASLLLAGISLFLIGKRDRPVPPTPGLLPLLYNESGSLPDPKRIAGRIYSPFSTGKGLCKGSHDHLSPPQSKIEWIFLLCPLFLS